MTRYYCDDCGEDCPQRVAGGCCEVEEEEASPGEQDWKAKLRRVAVDVEGELSRAVAAYASMNSAHEGWAVISEELDELWDEVRVKDGQRNVARMRQEAIQVAAMAIRFVIDVCGG